MPQIQPPSRSFQSQTRIQVDTLIWLRWMAVFGQTAAVLVGYWGLKVELPLAAVTLTISALVAANIAFRLLFPANIIGKEQIIAAFFAFDLLQLGTLLALTGGLNNPFALLILAPASIGTSLLTLRYAVLICSAALAVVIALELFSPPLHIGDQAIALPTLIRIGFGISLALGILFIGYYARRLWREVQMMNDALFATREALASEQKLTDLGGIVAATAHELGTPLATIKLVSKELATALEEDPELQEDAKLIHSQADRCRDIMRDMGRKGQEDHLRIPIPLQALVEEAAAPHSDRGHIEIEIDPASLPNTPTAQPMVTRQPEILHGLRNLVQNAVDFSTQQVTVTLYWDENQVRVTVQDDGPGFPPHLLNRLGTPIRRKNPAVARPNYEGMGLGLFIAKTLLKRTGAKLRFTNARGAVAEITWKKAELVKETSA